MQVTQIKLLEWEIHGFFFLSHSSRSFFHNLYLGNRISENNPWFSFDRWSSHFQWNSSNQHWLTQMHWFVASLFISRINVMISSLYRIGIFCPNTGNETLLWTNQTILNLPQHFENETKLTKLKLILSLDQGFTKSRALKAGLFVKSAFELNVKAKL